MSQNKHYEHDCCPNSINSREAELSNPLLQNVLPGNPLYLGEAIIGGNGPSIIYNNNNNLLLNRGTYLVSYSTSAVWTTTPYGTNEAIIALVLNNEILIDSISRVQVPPQPTDVGLVPFKLNLAKTVIINVTSDCSNLRLVNESTQVMGFENTVVTIIKLH